eukprot:262794-Pelagomonas_calceolata.AAC.4
MSGLAHVRPSSKPCKAMSGLAHVRPSSKPCKAMSGLAHVRPCSCQALLKAMQGHVRPSSCQALLRAMQGHVRPSSFQDLLKAMQWPPSLCVRHRPAQGHKAGHIPQLLGQYTRLHTKAGQLEVSDHARICPLNLVLLVLVEVLAVLPSLVPVSVPFRWSLCMTTG